MPQKSNFFGSAEKLIDVYWHINNIPIIVFNDVVAAASAVCNKISTKILSKATFIPISAAHSYNLQDTKYGNNTTAMPWYKGPSVLEKMNEISYTVHLPLHSFVSNARVAVIRVKALKNTKNLAFNFAPKSGTYRVWGYVTSTLHYFSLLKKFSELFLIFRRLDCHWGQSIYRSVVLETLQEQSIQSLRSIAVHRQVDPSIS